MTVHMFLAKAIMLLAMSTRWLRLLEGSKSLADQIDTFILEVQNHVEAVQL